MSVSASFRRISTPSPRLLTPSPSLPPILEEGPTPGVPTPIPSSPLRRNPLPLTAEQLHLSSSDEDSPRLVLKAPSSSDEEDSSPDLFKKKIIPEIMVQVPKKRETVDLYKRISTLREGIVSEQDKRLSRIVQSIEEAERKLANINTSKGNKKSRLRSQQKKEFLKAYLAQLRTQQTLQQKNPGLPEIFIMNANVEYTWVPDSKNLQEIIKSSDSCIYEKFRRNPHCLHRFINGLVRALKSLHEREVYHRDLNIGNIVVDRDGMPTIIDFEDAKLKGKRGPIDTYVLGNMAPKLEKQILEQESSYLGRETYVNYPEIDTHMLGICIFRFLSCHPITKDEADGRSWSPLVPLCGEKIMVKERKTIIFNNLAPPLQKTADRYLEPVLTVLAELLVYPTTTTSYPLI